jgi:hypothetical protein
VVAQIAAMEAGELLALARHLRPQWRSALCRWARRSCGSCGSACASGAPWRPETAGQGCRPGSRGKNSTGRLFALALRQATPCAPRPVQSPEEHPASALLYCRAEK